MCVCYGRWGWRGVSRDTILSLPMLHDIWHIKGGSEGGGVVHRTLRKSRAIVLRIAVVWLTCEWAGGVNKG